MKNFSTSEKALIFLGAFVFISLTALVFLKPEWLDNVFFKNPVYVIFPEEELEPSIEMSKAFLDVVVDEQENKASVFLNLDSSFDISGVEIFFDKDETLEILDFVCKEPFECLFKEFSDSEMSFAAIVPVGEVETFTGDVLVGELEYSGNGNLYFNSPANFVSVSQNSELNVLDLSVQEFSF